MNASESLTHVVYDISFLRPETNTLETFRFPLEPTLDVIASSNPDDPVVKLPLTQIQPGWLLRVGGSHDHPLGGVNYTGFYEVGAAGANEMPTY